MKQFKFILLGFRAVLAIGLGLTVWIGIGGRPSVTQAAATFTVNSTADLPDTDQGDGICLASNGACTLRAAIMQTNYTLGAETITLPAGTFQLTRPGNDDVAVLGDLDITDSLTIQGAGSGLTIVDGNGAVTGDRVFQILASAKQTSLSGLTIRNGKKVATFDEGGGIYWDGGGGYLHLTDIIVENNASYYGGGLYLNYSPQGDAVEMTQVIIRSNSATAAAGGLGVNFSDFASFHLLNSQVYSNSAYQGGGIYFQSTTTFGLTSVRVENTRVYSNTASLSAGFENHSGDASVPVVILNSDLYSNQASFYGGAIGNYGVLNISTTTLDANSAVTRGGGIYDYEGGQLNIEQSTLSRNSSQSGGGIYSELFIHNQAGVVLTNSTLSGNTASQDGAGIYAAGGQIKLFNVTIAGNQIIVPNGTTYAGLGGGVYSTSPAVVSAKNTLFGYNTHRYQTLPPVADDCFGPVTSLDYDLIQTTTNCTLSGITTDDITGQNPFLGPLQNNGGVAQTQSLLSGSPAIDTGQVSSCTDVNDAPILIDQRGAPRPMGTRCDIGAVEHFPYSIYLPGLRK
jgi:CSLREA domain-containing protein